MATLSMATDGTTTDVVGTSTDLESDRNSKFVTAMQL